MGLGEGGGGGGGRDRDECIGWRKRGKRQG